MSEEQLALYDAVVLSDIGALSLLLSPSARAGRPGTDRLRLLSDWVAKGGGLLMAGGYASFQGMDGFARYHETAVDDCLPVACRSTSDGLEAPEGLKPAIVAPGHPMVADLGQDWPPILGMNKTSARPDPEVEVIAECEHLGRRFPLLAARTFGMGRTLAWTTDIGPHWLSQQFASWEGHNRLMLNMINWMAGVI